MQLFNSLSCCNSCCCNSSDSTTSNCGDHHQTSRSSHTFNKMKRKSNYRNWFTSRIMVSRTALELCAFYAILQVCGSEVRVGNSNQENIVLISTTPMISTTSTTDTHHYNILPSPSVTKQFKTSHQFSPVNLNNSSNSNNNNNNNSNNNSSSSSNNINENITNNNTESNSRNNTVTYTKSDRDYTKNTGKKNGSLRTGNELWDGIIGDCYKKPTFSCFQKNVYTYLDSTLDTTDVNITNSIKLFKNQIDYTKYSKEANEPHEHSTKYNEIPNESRSESHLEDVTNALYGKSVKFMMTHDIELKLPEILFDGALVRISPRSLEGNGAIVKLEMIPKTELQQTQYGTGRIFFKKIKKIIQNKLLLSFLALILVIKLIKIKLFWLLPILVGVGTAKKLVLKFLLFLFPAFAHIFKLCSYYHADYHKTKYHSHHHHINHHHTIVPAWYGDHDHHPPAHAPEIIYTSPPKFPPHEVIHHPPSKHFNEHFSTGWESSGPGLGSEYISDIHRNAHVDINGFKPKLDDANEINSWGLGLGLGLGLGTTVSPSTSHSFNINPFLPDYRSVINQKTKPGPVYIGPQKNGAVAAQIVAQYDPNLNQQNMVRDVQRTQAQVKEALRIQAEQKLVAQQQKILHQQPFVQDSEPLMPKGYDPFYSPILSKMDKIFLQLGFTDDVCKERLVCSMYKNPNRYTPHSNFISAELSRDSSELEKPASTNAAVVKFYRLVEAAREGQDNQDCHHLYPHCSIGTE